MDISHQLPFGSCSGDGFFQTQFNVCGLFLKTMSGNATRGHRKPARAINERFFFLPFNYEFHLEEGDVDVTTMIWGQRQNNAAGLVEDSKILL